VDHLQGAERLSDLADGDRRHQLLPVLTSPFLRLVFLIAAVGLFACSECCPWPAVVAVTCD
jgi:hypothetical protein